MFCKSIASLLAAILLLATPDAVAFIRGGTSTLTISFNPAWQPLRLGAGGQITGIRNYSDNTTLIRTDTLGAYLYVTSGSCTYGGAAYSAPCYKQLVHASNIPSFSIDLANGDGGVVEIVAAPSNTNVLWMIYEKFLYISQDKGATWTKTTQGNTHSANDGNGSGPWIAIDPNNANTGFVATGSGVVKVTNALSSPAFASVASIPGDAAIVYEQGSSTHLLAAVIGGSTYESTNGSTFAITTGTPSGYTKLQLIVDKFAQFWLANASGAITTVARYASGTWNTSINPALHFEAIDVACDPNSAALGSNHCVVFNFEGEFSETTNNGSTWSGTPANVQTFGASGSQPAWLGNANQSTVSGIPNLNGYSGVFDQSSNLRFSGGIGVWKTSAPIVANGTTWAADSLGIEQLVVNYNITPPGGWPIAGVWDRGWFLQSNSDAFPSNYYPNTGSPPVIVFGWALDYASSDSTFVTGWGTDQNATTIPASSTDAWNTKTAWASVPATRPGAPGGWVAALTSQHWAAVPSTTAAMYFTLNGGTTWSQSTISGTPTNWITGQGVSVPLAADRVTANTYCAITMGRVVYASTDSGQNFGTTGLTSTQLDGANGSPNQFFFRSMPGQAGTFLYTMGEQSGSAGSHPANTHLYKITKTTNACDTAASVSANLKEVVAFGFGSPKPGSSPATIFAYGWLSGTLEFVQSTDLGVTWGPINVPVGSLTYALDSADLVSWLDGDPDIYGRINVGFRGSGQAYIDTADACPWVKFDPSTAKPNQSLTGTITLTANHSGLVPVTSVQFQVDGVNIGSAQTGQSSYSMSWNTGGVATGSHTLSVVTTGNGCTGVGSTQSFPVTTH